MSSGQSSPTTESSGGACPHGDDAAPAPAASSKTKLWRGMHAVYLVLVKKQQQKLAALGVYLHHLLSTSNRLPAREEQSPALMTYLSSLSCRSMDPAAAVVHPYPHGHRRASSSSRRHAAATAPSSLSCRSMDPAAAVCKYQYRPREVEFSCKSTPMHRRRREDKRRLRLQIRAADDHASSEPELYGSAAAVTRLFALMDVEEDVGYDDGDLDLDSLDAAAPWPAAGSSAPRQVRITDSPYLLAREEDNEELKSAVDRRADEFIMWFHEQLRTQQQQQRSTRNWVR